MQPAQCLFCASLKNSLSGANFPPALLLTIAEPTWPSPNRESSLAVSALKDVIQATGQLVSISNSYCRTVTLYTGALVARSPRIGWACSEIKFTVAVEITISVTPGSRSCNPSTLYSTLAFMCAFLAIKVTFINGLMCSPPFGSYSSCQDYIYKIDKVNQKTGCLGGFLFLVIGGCRH